MSSKNHEHEEVKAGKWQNFSEEMAEKKAQEVEQEANEGLEHVDYEVLQNQLNQAEEKVNSQQEQLLRLQAELENTRRRAEKEKGDAHKYAVSRLLNELIPVMDSLEQALQIKVGDDSLKSLHHGVELTAKLFLDVLTQFGVKQMNPEGERFDANYHEAMTMQDSNEMASGHIITVIQKGYELNGRLIRPARVIVAK